MVSKLILAVNQAFHEASDRGADPAVLDRLAEAYYDVRAGLGTHKTPEVYGAFPTDPYSHTPGHAGAKQPGMTGQVKEDILSRWGELGVRVSDGRIAFDPALLRADEFLAAPATFEFVDVGMEARTLELEAGTLAFTYCQVPIVYRNAAEPALRIVRADGSVEHVEGDTLSPETSAEVFGRTGAVARIEVDLKPAR